MKQTYLDTIATLNTIAYASKQDIRDRQLTQNIGQLWADCFSDKPMFKYLFLENSPEERYEKMLWAMERKARVTLAQLPHRLLDQGKKGSIFWFLPQQKPGFHPIQLIRAGLLGIPLKYGWQVFQRINQISLHELEVYSKHRKSNMWVVEGLGVTPSAQGAGLGAQLLRPTMEEIKQRGEHIFLLTHTPENIGFYEHLGFKLIDEVPLKNSAVVGYCFAW